MSDDFRDRLPDADRIRDRIREQRSDEYTRSDGGGKKVDLSDDPTFEQKIESPDADGVFKFDAVVDDRTSSLKWENIKESGEEAESAGPDEYFKLGDIVGESDEGFDKLGDIRGMVKNVESDPSAGQLDGYMKIPDIPGESVEPDAYLKLGDIEGMVKGVDGVVDHKADDFAAWPGPTAAPEPLGQKLGADEPDAYLKLGEVEGMVKGVDGVVGPKTEGFVDANDPDAAIFVKVTDLSGVVDHKADDVVDHKADDVVDHKADDFAERPTLGAETVHLSLADEPPGNDPDGYLKIDEVLGESIAEDQADSVLTNNENISGIVAESNPTPLVGAFDDITGGDQPAVAGKEIDPATPDVHDAADMKMELGLDKSSPKMESGVVADGAGTDPSGVTVGNSSEEVKAVASDPDNQDAFKVEIDGVDAGHVVDPLSDTVADALAPLDGGDELISMPEVDDAVDAASPSFDDDPLDGA